MLHNFDRYGFEILHSLTSVTDAAVEGDRVAYRFQNDIHFVDLGLRLDDVEDWGLESELVTFRDDFPFDSPATQAEQDFLRTRQRVELNAFTSPDFVKWLESKLEQHRIQKVVPDDETLADAYRRACHITIVNDQISDIVKEAEATVECIVAPDGMSETICDALARDPSRPWDDVVKGMAEDEIKGGSHDMTG